MLLGAHVSIAESISLAPRRGKAIGCEAIQIFSRSPRMLRKTKPLPPEEAAAFREAMAANGIRVAVVHANYLINLAAPRKPALRYSRAAFVEELERAQALGIRDVIFHPGAHLGKGESKALGTIAESLDACHSAARAPDVFATLENTAGQGSTVGHRFEQLAEVIQRSSYPDRLGVCVDTCHTFAAGYEFRTRDSYDELIRTIDGTIGLARVRAFHLNDSKGLLGSKVDRHEDIGKGHIGKEGFRFLVNDERFRGLPGCLEYPGDDKGYKRNLKVLRSLLTGEGSPGQPPGRPRGR